MARRIRRTIGPLDPRAQAILRAVIEEYVTSASPVGSQALVNRYGLSVSSATVRNILAELETAGLLTHPHTSAGRVPTDLGYRYYVESIMETVSLAPVEQLMIRHQFGQVEFASEHWFRLAATTLASVTSAAGIATPAKSPAARLRHVDVIGIRERLVSLIIVFREGTMKQVMVTLDQARSQDELAAVASRLNHELADLTAAEIEVRLAAIAPDALLDAVADSDAAGRQVDASIRARVLARHVADRIVRTMQDFDAALIEELFSDGLLNVMAAPEFAQSEKLRRVFAALETRVRDLVLAVADAGHVQVFIGEENPALEMHEVSLVLAPYGRPGRAVGVVGVLGPTRMSYPHAIGTVSFVSGLMNELIDHLYA